MKAFLKIIGQALLDFLKGAIPFIFLALAISGIYIASFYIPAERLTGFSIWYSLVIGIILGIYFWRTKK
jgi:hypothetical protein